MQVFNVRFGLATNSSSSHSIIFLPDGATARDYSGYPQEDPPGDAFGGDFGWQWFTAASPAAKLRYLGVLLRERLEQQLPRSIVDLICDHWLDQSPSESGDYIDHASVYSLPNGFNSTFPDEDFFTDLKRYLLQGQVVILGGNDNTSQKHPLNDGSAFTLPLPRSYRYESPYVCRHDDRYDFWTLFSPKDGRKIRFRLTNDPARFHDIPQRSEAPELVDIKITDYCPFGCNFCYQSSTPDGGHADITDIMSIAQTLGEMRVFEVALGGGEPTLHPDFVDVLEAFRERGVVPNFTTRNLGWLREPKRLKSIMELCGNFAVSVDSATMIEEVSTLTDYHGVGRERCNLHLVMGTMSQYVFRQLLDAASGRGLGVTLLGYKRQGFGRQISPIPYGWWLAEVQEVCNRNRGSFRVAIDTVLAAESREVLRAANIPDWMITFEDGKFSCYIDMVKRQMGPNSYCGSEGMVDFTDIQSPEEYYLTPERFKLAYDCF